MWVQQLVAETTKFSHLSSKHHRFSIHHFCLQTSEFHGSVSVPDAEEEENPPQLQPPPGGPHRLGDGLPRTPAALGLHQVRQPELRPPSTLVSASAL